VNAYMKRKKPKNPFKKPPQNFRLIYLPLVVALGLIAAFCSQILEPLFYFNAVFIVLLIALFFLPLKKIQ